MTKILYLLACDIALTGTPLFVKNIIEGLDKAKYDFTVMTPFSENERVYSSHVRVYQGGLSKVPKVFPEVKIFKMLDDLCFRGDGWPDIVHINTADISMAKTYIKYFRSRGNTKIICHSHNIINYRKNYLYQRLILHFKHYIVKNADELWACSKEAGISMFGGYPGFHLVKNYVDAGRFSYNKVSRKEIRDLYGISDDTILLGHIGAFNGQKNQQFLLRIVRELDLRYKLMLIGNGKEKKERENYCQIHSLQERVIFCQEQENIEKYYSAFDVLLFPSFFEGFPLVLLESVAADLCAIVSVNVPHNDVFMCSYLPLEEDMWINEIEKVVNNIESRKDNTDRLIKYGCEKKCMIPKIEEMYKHVLSGTPEVK